MVNKLLSGAAPPNREWVNPLCGRTGICNRQQQQHHCSSPCSWQSINWLLGGSEQEPFPWPLSHHSSGKAGRKKMPLYVDPHPLVAAAASTFLGNLTFPHHCSVLLFSIKHYSHCSSLCLCNYISSKFSYLPAASVFHTLLYVLMLDRSSCICFVSLTVHICRMLNWQSTSSFF